MTRVCEAERLRQCREAFALAVASGTTVAEARRMLAQRRWAEADARLAAKRCGTLAEPVAPALGDAPWMMRD